MQKEIWKEVPGYKGIYQVSDQGRVRSLDRECWNGRSIYKRKGIVLSQSVSKKGYYTIRLNLKNKAKTFSVHQLVAMAFLNHKPDGNKIVVDHRDNNPLNNNLSNLQLISNRENVSKDLKNKTSKYTGVSWCKRDKRWKSAIKIKGKLKHLGSFKCELAAAAAYQKELIKLNK